MTQPTGLRLLALALNRYWEFLGPIKREQRPYKNFKEFSKHISDVVKATNIGDGNIGEQAVANIISDLRNDEHISYDIIEFGPRNKISDAIAIYVLKLNRESYQKMRMSLQKTFNAHHPLVNKDIITTWESYIYSDLNKNQKATIVKKIDENTSSFKSDIIMALIDVLKEKGYYLQQNLIAELEKVTIILNSKSSEATIILKEEFDGHKTLKSSGFDGVNTLMIFVTNWSTIEKLKDVYEQHNSIIDEAVIQVEDISIPVTSLL